MSSITTHIVQTDSRLVTRARTVASCPRPSVSTAGYRATGTENHAARTLATAGTWLAIGTPMSKVDFHDRWPLRTTL